MKSARTKLFVSSIIIIPLIAALAGYYVWIHQEQTVLSPIVKMFEKPLEKYAIERIGEQTIVPSQIILDEAVATGSAYTAYAFHFMVDGKKVTGLAHLPLRQEELQKVPVIVQFRGYVEREKFTSGEGTRRSAQVFAANGFISLAPDFLGYGGSDMPSIDVFEERFQTYWVGLHLLASIKSLSIADPDRVGVWGHSNGGQIALTILEATKRPYPTSLWAPVTKPFPYSILYYTDEADDRGKALRKKLAEFEQDYDTDLYSLTTYIDRIQAPIQLHQGGKDDAVPQKWSDEFVESLKKNDRDVQYFIYPEADHNMTPSWSTVVNRDIEFFRSRMP